jgi:hypothetical protein
MKNQMRKVGGIVLPLLVFWSCIGVHALSGYPDSFELRKIKKS